MTASAAKAAEGYSCRVALGLGKPEIPSAGGSGRLSKPVRTRQPLRLAGPIAWSIIIALVIVISLTLGSRAEAGGLLWLVETVDAGEGVGVYTSITLDDQGRPHIVYVDRKTDTVKYAVREAGVWETRVVDAGGGFAGSTNLIVDTQGQPHVSYFSEKRNALLYAVGNGSQWERHRVDAPVIRGFHGLALDSHGRPYLAYAYLNTKLRYAHWNGEEWQLEVVDPETIDVRYISLALDSEDFPQIAYQGFGVLRYALWDGNRWVLEVVDDSEEVGGFARLVIDSRGAAHIAYRDAQEGDLRYAWREGSFWNLEQVDMHGDAGWDIGLALGAGDVVHMAYYERMDSELRHARRSGDGWLIDIVETEGVVGWYASVVVDPMGNPHLSYYHWSQKGLRYAVGLLQLAAQTLPAADVTPTSALLRGDLKSTGDFPQAEVFFEWRPVGELAWQTTEPETLLRAGPYERILTDLTPGQGYEYRARANADGTVSVGDAVSFLTPLPPDTEGAARLVLVTLIALGILVGLVLLWGTVAARDWLREGDRQRQRER